MRRANNASIHRCKTYKLLDYISKTKAVLLLDIYYQPIYIRNTLVSTLFTTLLMNTVKRKGHKGIEK